MRARPPLVATDNVSFCFLWEVEVSFRVCFIFEWLCIFLDYSESML
jgi:hypothetical protein